MKHDIHYIYMHCKLLHEKKKEEEYLQPIKLQQTFERV
jgi:hypothetical protein